MSDLLSWSIEEIIEMSVINPGTCIKYEGSPEVLEKIIKMYELKEKLSTFCSYGIDGYQNEVCVLDVYLFIDKNNHDSWGIMYEDTYYDHLDQHCGQCENEFLVTKFCESENFPWTKMIVAVGQEKMEKISNNSLPEFENNFILVGSILEEEKCLNKLKEIYKI